MLPDITILEAQALLTHGRLTCITRNAMHFLTSNVLITRKRTRKYCSCAKSGGCGSYSSLLIIKQWNAWHFLFFCLKATIEGMTHLIYKCVSPPLLVSRGYWNTYYIFYRYAKNVYRVSPRKLANIQNTGIRKLVREWVQFFMGSLKF